MAARRPCVTARVALSLRGMLISTVRVCVCVGGVCVCTKVTKLFSCRVYPVPMVEVLLQHQQQQQQRRRQLESSVSVSVRSWSSVASVAFVARGVRLCGPVSPVSVVVQGACARDRCGH